MFRALYTAATGMTAQQLNLDNVANNLANSSTAGFRARRLQFQDLMYQSLVVPGAAATQQTTIATGLQVGLGARPTASEIMQTQGEFQSTGNPLDLAIQGQGFFQVQLPDGQTGYTRAGQFHLDSQGNLVTSEGNPVQPSITIPADAQTITMGTDGTVTITQPGQSQAQQVGSIQLATFANPGGLNSIGQNLFLATTASGDAVVGTPGGSEGIGTLQQGVLEQSNVSVVDEFIQMILAQRSYQSASNTISGAIPGVTLNLSGAVPDTDVTLSVSPDASGVASALNTFVSDYNSIISSINSQFTYNAMSSSSGVLSGDSSVRLVQDALLSLTSFSMSGNGTIDSLQALGVSMSDDGTLALDSSKLNTALTSNFSDLVNFLQSGPGSFGEALSKTMMSLNNPANGPLALDVNSIQQTNRDLTNQINDFEANLTAQERVLTQRYSQINAQLQQLPLLQNQVSQALGSLDPYLNSSSSSNSSS